VVTIYRVEFFAKCPNNGIRIKYALRIETNRTIPVEVLLECVENQEGFHEDIADRLSALGGQQTLIAEHHGVTVETERP
jgi:hypothetical protein